MKEIEQVWAIRLKNRGYRYLTKNKPCGLRFGTFRNAIKFSSKYKAKKVYNELKDNCEIELYRWI